MKIRNITFGIISIVLITEACNSYDDSTCTVCYEQNALIALEMCGIDANVSLFEYNLVKSGDSIEFYDTIRAGDIILIDTTVDISTKKKRDTLVAFDSLYDELADSSLLYISYVDSSATWVTLSDTNYIVYTSDTTHNDSVLSVYSDFTTYDSARRYRTVCEVIRYQYDEPATSEDGQTIYTVLTNSVISRYFDTITVETIDLDEDLNIDTCTYKKYFQQKWVCTRE